MDWILIQKISRQLNFSAYIFRQNKISAKFFCLLQYPCPNWHDLLTKKAYQLGIISDFNSVFAVVGNWAKLNPGQKLKLRSLFIFLLKKTGLMNPFRNYVTRYFSKNLTMNRKTYQFGACQLGHEYCNNINMVLLKVLQCW